MNSDTTTPEPFAEGEPAPDSGEQTVETTGPQPQRPRWLWWVVGAATVLVVAALAAGIAVATGGSGTGEQGGAATAREQYDTVEQLRDAVEAAGYECTMFERVATPTNAVERAACTSEVTLAIHTDNAQAWASVRAVNTLLDGTGLKSVHLVGSNWTVNCGDLERTCEQLHEAMGGQLDRHQPASARTYYTPKPEDFELTARILSKDCFESAGCLIEFRIELGYSGGDLDPSTTYEITYEVHGGEDPYINTLEVTGTRYSTDESEDISTASSDDDLVVEILSISER